MMSYIVANEYIFIPLLAGTVFLFSYLNFDRILNFLHEKSLGSREEVLRLMDLMFVDTNRSKVTAAMLLMSFGLGGLVFLVAWPNLFAGAFFGALVTVIGWSIPKLVVTSLWQSRCSRIVDQMVDGLTIMANGIKSGLSVTQSMERVIENMGGPLGQEFGLVLKKIRLGMTLEESLNEFADRVPQQDVQMFVTAINILKETGGNLAETFQTIVTTIRERQKIHKKIKAMTQMATTQALIITMVPFVLLGVFALVDPAYVRPLFTSVLGWVALFLILFLQVLGGVLMKKIVTIKV